MKITSCSFRCVAGALVAIATASLSGTAHAAALLNNVNLGGTQQTVYWEAPVSNGEIANGGALSSANAAGTPTSGVGTIAPGAPGFRAGLGYYSYSTNFSLTASTSIQNGAFSDIQNVVFQRTSMLNPGDELNPLTADDNLTHGGGPILTYTYLDGGNPMTGQLAATLMGIGGSLEAPGAAMPGTFYNFTYQWDLSSIAQDITSVSIWSPILVHSSTAEARIDIGGTYVQVIPEPASAGLAALGLAGILIRRRR